MSRSKLRRQERRAARDRKRAALLPEPKLSPYYTGHTEKDHANHRQPE